ncbi:hypothetical protein BOTCAL_0024g00310 [Botryotinia calthae]|uniref:Uncharacterized protein n=1 Tax=Botryotinia calthae TaxID=38488 RepID=A0A4Y8DEE6_9HELO|nr:hypothetical protein BOTCAL_0024g00310 [Botryotinia calthae]
MPWEYRFVVVPVSTVLKNERVAAMSAVLGTPCNKESIFMAIVAKVNPEKIARDENARIWRAAYTPKEYALRLSVDVDASAQS